MGEQFDENRILRGEVSDEEREQLEHRLLEMFLERAQKAGKQVLVMTDAVEFEHYKQADALEEPSLYRVYGDAQGNVYVPSVLQHLLDTKEGLFYAKLTLRP